MDAFSGAPLSKNNFPLDPQALGLYIPMTKQTLNRDGMVTSVEFSCGDGS
jgi:hypothetical protein